MAFIDDRGMEKQARAENAEYYQLLQQGDHGLRKASELHSDQLVNYLREACVMDKILTARPITAADCEPGINNDTLYKRLYMQPELRTFQSSFESLPREVQEIFIPRIFLGFYLMSSPKVVLNDYNLMAYPFPVTKQVEDLIGPSMHEAIDWVMLNRLETALLDARTGGDPYGNIVKGIQAQADVAARGAYVAGATAGAFRGQIERDDVLTLIKYFAGTRARIQKVLCTQEDWVDVFRFKVSDFGDEMMGQVFREGYTDNKIHGVEFIRTIKSDMARGDLLRKGNLYGFPDEEMVGRSYVLQGLRFFFERDHHFIYFDAHQARGFIWAVTSRIIKMELYNGGLSADGSAVTANNSDTMYGDPSQVTFKDYYDVQDERYRPAIKFA